MPLDLAIISPEDGTRRAILTVSPEFVLDFGKTRVHHFGVIANEIPYDAEIIKIGIANSCFRLVLESVHFAPIAKGDPLPILPPPVFQRL